MTDIAEDVTTWFTGSFGREVDMVGTETLVFPSLIPDPSGGAQIAWSFVGVIPSPVIGQKIAGNAMILNGVPDREEIIALGKSMAESLLQQRSALLAEQSSQPLGNLGQLGEPMAWKG